MCAQVSPADMVTRALQPQELSTWCGVQMPTRITGRSEDVQTQGFLEGKCNLQAPVLFLSKGHPVLRANQPMGYTHSGRGASPAQKVSKPFQGEKYFILLQPDKSCWDLDVIRKIRLGRRE